MAPRVHCSFTLKRKDGSENMSANPISVTENQTTFTHSELAAILNQNAVSLFKFYPEEDMLLLFNEKLEVRFSIPNFYERLKSGYPLSIEDGEQVAKLLRGEINGPVEYTGPRPNGENHPQLMEVSRVKDSATGKEILIGSVRDVTNEKVREDALREQADRDSLTGLYNHIAGKERIEASLREKTPYTSCGLMILDIDYFKAVNDNFGHLFGDEVLTRLADLLTKNDDSDVIIARIGGDEFVVFFKDITHGTLFQNATHLMETVRSLSFKEQDYCMTCSAGICFLPENALGYSYDQIFANADWALYRAKENGRNRFEFCDSLNRFELMENKATTSTGLDARYLRNDIISTAFEIFEKSSNFPSAMQLLLEVIGTRFQLDRITVVRTDIAAQNAGKDYQWTSEQAPPVLAVPGSFTKEDFLTLFHSYDEFGTTVLQYDDLDMYSPDARALLMQGEAKTVLYAAMYSDGNYVGAISYVVCGAKRNFSSIMRKEFSELTRIISAHLARNRAINGDGNFKKFHAEYDHLTGLPIFDRFHENVERTIVGGFASSCALIYSDFVNFKYFNQCYGYHEGDQLLKSFCSFLIEKSTDMGNVFLARIVADEFVLLLPCEDAEALATRIDGFNKEFLGRLASKYPKVELSLRTGIYPIAEECGGASEAIDAANFARRQVHIGSKSSVRLFDQALFDRRRRENELLNDLNQPHDKEKFHVSIQTAPAKAEEGKVDTEALIHLQCESASMSAAFLDQLAGLIENLGYEVEMKEKGND